jgi:hypothetical protein
MTYRIEIRRVFEEPAPCDDCNKRYICEEQELACRAFSGYVVNGKMYEHTVRIPTNAIFNKIFKEDDPGALTKLLQSLNATQGELPI